MKKLSCRAEVISRICSKLVPEWATKLVMLILVHSLSPYDMYLFPLDVLFCNSTKQNMIFLPAPKCFVKILLYSQVFLAAVNVPVE